MLTYVLRRFVYSIPVFLVASFLVYWGVSTTFNPLAKYSASRDPTLIARERKVLGLDRPIVSRWWSWLTHLFRGDLGRSNTSNNSVWSILMHHLWPTLQIMFWGTLIALLFAIGIGVYSAVKQYSPGDYFLTGTSYIGISMPPYVTGLIAIAFFVTFLRSHFNLAHPIFYSVGLHNEGVKGFNLDYARHLALPVLTLSVQSIAAWSRFERASMLDVLHADYVRTARAKGVPRRKVVFRHAFRNALIPLVTVVALDTAFLIGGLVITEKIFSIAGMGTLFIDSLFVGDVPVLLGWFIVVATIVILFNLLADIGYGLLDPRIRLG